MTVDLVVHDAHEGSRASKLIVDSQAFASWRILGSTSSTSSQGARVRQDSGSDSEGQTMEELISSRTRKQPPGMRLHVEQRLIIDDCDGSSPPPDDGDDSDASGKPSSPPRAPLPGSSLEQPMDGLG